MTSTTPTRTARNRQVSSHIANDDNSVGLSAAAQNLLSAKPIIDLVKKIAKLTLFLPETVPLATEEDDIPRRIFELEGEDGTVASTFNAESISLQCPRRNPTVAFRRLNPKLFEKVKHKAADHSNSDSETDSDSDKESDSPTVVAESVPSNTVVSALAVREEPLHSEDEETDRICHRYHRKRRATKTKGKNKVFPSHTTFVVDPDINLRSAGLKELLSDEPSAPKTRAAVVIGVGASSSDNQDLWEGW
ncbi:hypothetical protein DFH09DRAFT_1360154 [Mycena vulgaris]|nr:hypothetical protein DFH09DRAFT_1360154 [Mycena vulgaris]